MVRNLSILLAASALAGCVVPEAEYGYRAPVVYSPSTRPPPGPTIYDTATRAVAHSELLACRNRGSNLGEIGMRGETLLYTPYIETPAGPLLRMPVETACLSSGFGWRGSLDAGRAHNGLDLANPNGGFIYAAGDGYIRRAEYFGGYGNTVEIDHGNGVVTRYAHLNEINPNLRPGDFIAAGTPMARMGMTGNATGVHLHYELYISDLLVDPLHYGRPPTMVSAPAPQDAIIEQAPIEDPNY